MVRSTSIEMQTPWLCNQFWSGQLDKRTFSICASFGESWVRKVVRL